LCFGIDGRCVSAADLYLSAAPRLVLSTAVVGPSASASWLSATIGASQACTTRSGNCLPVNIALNTGSLALGAYTESVTLTNPNAVDSPQQFLSP
jgi:hypothetical protein